MIVRKILYSSLSVLLILTLICGCDVGLEITSIVIGDLPEKTVYECGIDTELDLSGGTVLINTLDGHSTPANMNLSEFEVNHNVDFNTKGTYKVTVSHSEFSCEFTVTVE